MNNFYRSLCAALTLLLLCAVLIPVGARAASGIYINGSADSVTDLSSLYAIGGGGASRLGSGTAYALTSSGVKEVGGGGGGTVSTDAPGHLGVSTSVALSSDLVRVGLYYYDGESSIRNPTLEVANLENSVGSGYEFGYYDASRVFHPVASTAETKISMVIDKNVDTDAWHLGCYHIKLGGGYSDLASALAAASQVTGGFPAYYNGTYYALMGSYDSAEEAGAAIASLGISGEAYSASDRCVTVVRTTDGAILFEFDCGSGYSLAVRPISPSAKAVTWFKQTRYYGDFEYSRRTGGKMTVTNIVDIEDYVKGILPYEMSASWPLEALKAQAVCARTFAAASYGKFRNSYGFDVSNDATSQVYRGITLATANSNSAVDATAGQYIVSGGKLITAYYYSSNGGGTAASEHVFGGALSYAKGKLDPFEAAANSINSRSSWTFTFTKERLTSALKSFNVNMSTVVSMEPTYSESGNVIALKFTDAAGKTVAFSNANCYNFSTGKLGLYSIHYTVTDNGSSVTINGGGWGHSVGMSQFGAYAMAKSYGFTYDQIINFYYTGVALANGVAA